MKKLIRNFISEDGQSMVEFALVFPILLLILCGIIDFGWIFSNQLSLNNCSREGARYAIVNGEKSAVIAETVARAKNACPDNLKEKLNVTVTFTNQTYPIAGDVTVYTTAKLKTLTPIVGMFFQNSEVELKSTTVMRMQ